jgi:hypothetical protein
MSLNTRQQFFFQPSPALPKSRNLYLKTIKELADLVVLVTNGVKACACRY